MALKTLTNITDAQLKAYGVSALATRPNAPSTYGAGGLSAEELKAKFDNLGKMLAKAINDINTALNTDGASYISLEIGAEIKSLADLSTAYLNGTFANVLKAYEKATDIGDTEKLATLQTILSSFSQRLAEVESVGDITTLEQAKAYTDTQDIATLASAKTYADTKDTTNLASAKSYTDTKIASIINSAPATFDTLKEIADWIASDVSGTSALIARVTALEDDYSGSSGSSTVSFTQAGTRANIATGETLAVLMGKIKKWFADLGALAFKASIAYSEVTGTPTLGTVASKNTGTTSGTIPVLDSNGKLATSIVPDVAVDVIRYNTTQNLSSTEKAKARSNMGAGTSDFSGSYTDLTSKPTLGTASSKNTGTTQGTIPVIGAGGKIGRYLVPNADGSLLGTVAGLPFANATTKEGATYAQILIGDAGDAYAYYPIVDTAMSDSSINLVQNKIVKAYVDGIVGDIETLLAGV